MEAIVCVLYIYDYIEGHLSRSLCSQSIPAKQVFLAFWKFPNLLCANSLYSISFYTILILRETWVSTYFLQMEEIQRVVLLLLQSEKQN